MAEVSTQIEQKWVVDYNSEKLGVPADQDLAELGEKVDEMIATQETLKEYHNQVKKDNRIFSPERRSNRKEQKEASKTIKKLNKIKAKTNIAQESWIPTTSYEANNLNTQVNMIENNLGAKNVIWSMQWEILELTQLTQIQSQINSLMIQKNISKLSLVEQWEITRLNSWINEYLDYYDNQADKWKIMSFEKRLKKEKKTTLTDFQKRTFELAKLGSVLGILDNMQNNTVNNNSGVENVNNVVGNWFAHSCNNPETLAKLVTWKTNQRWNSVYSEIKDRWAPEFVAQWAWLAVKAVPLIVWWVLAWKTIQSIRRLAFKTKSREDFGKNLGDLALPWLAMIALFTDYKQFAKKLKDATGVDIWELLTFTWTSGAKYDLSDPNWLLNAAESNEKEIPKTEKEKYIFPEMVKWSVLNMPYSQLQTALNFGSDGSIESVDYDKLLTLAGSDANMVANINNLKKIDEDWTIFTKVFNDKWINQKRMQDNPDMYLAQEYLNDIINQSKEIKKKVILEKINGTTWLAVALDKKKNELVEAIVWDEDLLEKYIKEPPEITIEMDGSEVVLKSNNQMTALDIKWLKIKNKSRWSSSYDKNLPFNLSSISELLRVANKQNEIINTYSGVSPYARSAINYDNSWDITMKFGPSDWSDPTTWTQWEVREMLSGWWLSGLSSNAPNLNSNRNNFVMYLKDLDLRQNDWVRQAVTALVTSSGLTYQPWSNEFDILSELYREIQTNKTDIQRIEANGDIIKKDWTKISFKEWIAEKNKTLWEKIWGVFASAWNWIWSFVKWSFDYVVDAYEKTNRETKTYDIINTEVKDWKTYIKFKVWSNEVVIEQNSDVTVSWNKVTLLGWKDKFMSWYVDPLTWETKLELVWWKVVDGASWVLTEWLSKVMYGVGNIAFHVKEAIIKKTVAMVKWIFNVEVDEKEIDRYMQYSMWPALTMDTFNTITYKWWSTDENRELDSQSEEYKQKIKEYTDIRHEYETNKVKEIFSQWNKSVDEVMKSVYGRIEQASTEKVWRNNIKVSDIYGRKMQYVRFVQECMKEDYTKPFASNLSIYSDVVYLAYSLNTKSKFGSDKTKSNLVKEVKEVTVWTPPKKVYEDVYEDTPPNNQWAYTIIETKLDITLTADQKASIDKMILKAKELDT